MDRKEIRMYSNFEEIQKSILSETASLGERIYTRSFLLYRKRPRNLSQKMRM